MVTLKKILRVMNPARTMLVLTILGALLNLIAQYLIYHLPFSTFMPQLIFSSGIGLLVWLSLVAVKGKHGIN